MSKLVVKTCNNNSNNNNNNNNNNINILILGDYKIGDRERQKVAKYQDLKREVERLWVIREVLVHHSPSCGCAWPCHRKVRLMNG